MMIQAQFGKHAANLNTMDDVGFPRSPLLAVVRQNGLLVCLRYQLQFVAVESGCRPLYQLFIRHRYSQPLLHLENSLTL
jgi:hypothetical protein